MLALGVDDLVLDCTRDGLYRQIEKLSQYSQHVARHMVEDVGMKSVSCPHPSCEMHGCERDELREHFSSVHHIPLTLP